LAKSNVISQEDAIFKLFGIDSLLFRKDFEDVLKQSLQKEKECPIKMGGSGALELIYYACEFTQAKNAIETGVAQICRILGKMDSHVGCIVPENLKKYWRLFRFADKESLPKIFAENKIFDVVHYDSDKSYKERFWAYGELYKHLRKGGVFISDDIGDNSAYQNFCEKNNIQTIIGEFEEKFVGAFVK
jgi:hypothetical protein